MYTKIYLTTQSKIQEYTVILPGEIINLQKLLKEFLLVVKKMIIAHLGVFSQKKLFMIKIKKI